MIERWVAKLNDLLPSETSPSWPIALARISMGVLWLGSLRWKLPPDFVAGEGTTGLRSWLELEVEHAAFAAYGELIDTVVLANFTLFAWLIFLTELAVGAALLTGVGTRIAAFVGLLMSLNLLIGLLEVPGEWPWAYVMMIMWHGTILVSTSDQIWSLTARRTNRQPTPVRN